jgi:PilZ domain
MRTDTASSEASLGFSDRRRHVRYRFSAPITVEPNGRSAIRGMSLEISESGMSALIGDVLVVGDTVGLEPVLGSRVTALVRRQSGKIYGFEFLNLAPEEIQRIAEVCKALPKYECKTLDI